MSDLRLDVSTHDLVIEEFGLSVHTRIESAILQRIKIRLMNIRGEWFRDITDGIPYYQQIFGKTYTQGLAENYIRTTIITTEGIVSLTNFKSTVYGKAMSVVFSAKTEGGSILTDIEVTL